MPTAEQFTAMVGRLTLVDDYLSGVPRAVSDAVEATAIRGGRVADLVSDTIARNELDVATARGHLATAIERCLDRAEQCRRYSDRYDAYETAADSYTERAARLEPGEYLGSPPWPPRSPGPWAERS